MSGVFGILDSKRHPHPEALERMRRSLHLFPWTQTQTWQDPAKGVGLGQVNIGKFSSGQQPVRSDSSQVQVVFFGELYSRDRYAKALGQHPEDLRGKRDSELVLALYLELGQEFIHHLDGVFVLAVWDNREERLMVANDRLGLLPLYYAHTDGKFVFAPEIKALLTDPGFHKCLDLDALAQFMRFQRLLGDHTFFEDIKILPNASFLEYHPRRNSLNLHSYWAFTSIQPFPSDFDFPTAVEEASRLLKSSIAKRTAGDFSLGVYLSGGLDSRTVLGLASRIKPIKSVTYGLSNSRDFQYAVKIARRVGSEHHAFPQDDGRWVLDEIDTHLEITEGFTTWVHGHAGSSLLSARELIDINLTGYLGDVLLGGSGLLMAPYIRNAVDDIDFTQQMFKHWNQDYCWPGINEGEEKLLFTELYYEQIRDRAFSSLQSALCRYEGAEFISRLTYFDIENQSTRLTNLNTLYQRAYFEARYPFCDYELVEFVLALPFSFRVSNRLYLSVITKSCPKVTWVPRDKDNLLPTSRTLVRQGHALLHRVYSRLVNRGLFTLHNDPEGWLRNDLRGWAEELLFDKRTLERGIFNPAYIHSIYQRHISGKEIHTIGKIAPIMTYEMMLRRFYD